MDPELNLINATLRKARSFRERAAAYETFIDAAKALARNREFHGESRLSSLDGAIQVAKLHAQRWNADARDCGNAARLMDTHGYMQHAVQCIIAMGIASTTRGVEEALLDYGFTEAEADEIVATVREENPEMFEDLARD